MIAYMIYYVPNPISPVKRQKTAGRSNRQVKSTNNQQQIKKDKQKHNYMPQT